ncbi:MAG: carbamoyl phosphate synthase small subunit [Deltaproteobacteria bacterium RIFCSPLOWO2_12_FULL_43_16]|nr:MAG: carbamoyl phosphate synthase small subunit [Deltaproteobacteria bacterium GWA2_43_19]OGQ12978.1 MAG: carbamoyl phosphate synthase small subunit [Deltaproteobacteria bacterium RIFCSPHIGHO2_02_FULL_43_33]OGQ36293.1 MAG: carbamoyl phosphate synthase small subunit [Deltaproteobacteria bacterium RIFCSPLOWO2_01_FULL_42_9]OGQ58404.1 MAG: carbamoyl phosphate synthase small subunit [Deltaproteobacteria bacterium RIFCSPLOWO2_12_FULL_43_16]HBR16466.1 carbamoyl phosphate synthase small subunit [Del
MTLSKNKKAILALADGTVFEGHSFGAEGESIGEVVFNTSMCGYQEVLTDPSYKGQMVAMTYTQIGNYGVDEEDIESNKLWLEGFIVKEYCDYPSNWRAKETLGNYLKRNNIVGIKSIDTRALTRHLRDNGAMNGVISTLGLDPVRLVKKAKEFPSMAGLDLAKEVTCKESYRWNQGLWDLEEGYGHGSRPQFTVIAYDFGMKFNILRNLINVGCDVTVVPASTSAEDVLKMNPDGIFLSNGPGDPDAVTYAIENVRKLIGKKPIFGICLGHQILGLALGGKTYKLKFGHHGGNQPVKDLTTNKVEITSQNHGFAVDVDSLKGIAELTHVNLNDKTVEGLAHTKLPLFSVQYHPEASPGPHDSSYLFKRFTDMMEGKWNFKSI